MKSRLITHALACALALGTACASATNTNEQANATSESSTANADATNSSEVATEVVSDTSIEGEPEAGPPTPKTESAEALEHFEKGMQAYKRNRDKEAVEAFAAAVKADSDFAEAHYRLGLAYVATKQPK